MRVCLCTPGTGANVNASNPNCAGVRGSCYWSHCGNWIWDRARTYKHKPTKPCDTVLLKSIFNLVPRPNTPPAHKRSFLQVFSFTNMPCHSMSPAASTLKAFRFGKNWNKIGKENCKGKNRCQLEYQPDLSANVFVQNTLKKVFERKVIHN